jgi:glycosyltransferase involved in cell wall biosynthesis
VSDTPRDPRRPLRVAIVCDGIGEVVAGSFISATRFAERLSARGHRVVLVSSGRPFGGRTADYRGMRLHRFRGVLIPWSDGQLYLGIPSARRIRTILEDEGIDIVHVMIPMPLGLVAARTAKSMGLPVVMHSHTQPENIFMSAPRLPGAAALTRRFRAYLNWIYGQADVMVYPSAFSRRQFPELSASPNVVISNGVDTERFRPAPADQFMRRFGLSKSKLNLLYLGRLHKEKNVETLVRGMAMIHKRHPGTHLFIVGLGYDKPVLAQLAAREGITSEITFCGFVPDAELPAAYSACDLFVLPSLAELEGMAVLEAMACGKALLIANSRDSAATDFVQDNGLLFEARNPENLAAQAGRLLCDPDGLRAMGVRSLQASRRFDIRESVAALESLYYSLAQAL